MLPLYLIRGYQMDDKRTGFVSGKGLTQLDLSQNGLVSVPSAAFRNLVHLLILNLNHNKITAIHNKAFEGLDTLEILLLYENKIASVEPDAFMGLNK
jgi:Leucine-rich repeat (LRR) protein